MIFQGLISGDTGMAKLAFVNRRFAFPTGGGCQVALARFTEEAVFAVAVQLHCIPHSNEYLICYIG